MVDRAQWIPPLLPERDSSQEKVRGALYGSLLFEQPEHRAWADRLLAFLEPAGQVALEIGFDHGMRLLDHARRWPEIRWLGVEIRKSKVDAASVHAPPNAMLLRADARTLLATLIPAHRLEYVYILFPTPAVKAHHLLVTPSLVHSLERTLTPTGRVALATDVPAMADWIDKHFTNWPLGEEVPMGPVLSRRERICARDGVPVWRTVRRRP